MLSPVGRVVNHRRGTVSLPPALLNSLCVHFGRRADPRGDHQLCGEGAAVASSPGRDPHDHCRLPDLV